MSIEVQTFLMELIKQRIDLISDELGRKIQKPAASPSSSNNSDNEGEEDMFSSNERRTTVVGSVIQEQFEIKNLKKTLKERLQSYRKAIEYCNYLAQPKHIIESLLERAEIIMKFIQTFDCRDESEHLELIFKLPRDITPEDVLGKDEKFNYVEFQRHIRYIEKLIPQLQKARVQHMNLFKKQKDPISKENYQKLTKMVESQNAVKAELMDLITNRWQPLPEFHISDEHIISSVDTLDCTVLQVEIILPDSYKSTYFSYYFVIRLIKIRDVIDTHEIQIAGKTASTSFSLDKEDSSKINMFKVEIELFQWRLKIFDIILDDAEFSLITLMNNKSFKRSTTWDDEKFSFQFTLLDQEEQNDEVFKLYNIIKIPDPFKINEMTNRISKPLEEVKAQPVKVNQSVKVASVKAPVKAQVKAPVKAPAKPQEETKVLSDSKPVAKAPKKQLEAPIVVTVDLTPPPKPKAVESKLI